MNNLDFELEAMTKLMQIRLNQLMSVELLRTRYTWLKLLEKRAEERRLLQVLRHTRIEIKNLEIFCRENHINI